MLPVLLHELCSEAMPMSIGNSDKELDLLEFQAVWLRLVAISAEAEAALVRTAFSSVITEARDFACMLVDPEGRLVAHPTGTNGTFVSTGPLTVRKHVLESFKKEMIQDGDVFISNDPWTGTGHLNDVTLVAPIYHHDVLVAFGVVVAHMADIGGKLRSPEAKELFEEGLQIPVSKFLDQGTVDPIVEAFIRRNVRVPDQVIGDLMGMVAAAGLMTRRIQELISTYELNDLKTVVTRIFSLTEKEIRRQISLLPNGTYQYELASDGYEKPLRIRASVLIADNAVAIDFSGSSEQQPRGINAPLQYVYVHSILALKCLLSPLTPHNDGVFRCISVTAPEGTIVNAMYPAPVGARALTGHYVNQVIFGALAEVVPDRVIAPCGSAPIWGLTASAKDSAGKPIALVTFFNGGMGASERADGRDCLGFPANVANTSVEVLDIESPFRVRSKRIRTGSGGNGLHRGGNGQEVVLEVTGEEPVLVAFLADKTKVDTPGLLGGQAGARGEVLLNGSPIDHRAQHLLRPGSVLTLRTPAGAGFGEPQNTIS